MPKIDTTLIQINSSSFETFNPRVDKVIIDRIAIREYDWPMVLYYKKPPMPISPFVSRIIFQITIQQYETFNSPNTIPMRIIDKVQENAYCLI